MARDHLMRSQARKEKAKESKRVSRAKPEVEIPPRPVLESKRTTVAILVVLFAIGVLVRLQHLGDVTSLTPDEHVYTYYAQRILTKGLGEFPLLIQEYNGDQRYWIYPPPMRAGYLAILAGAMKVGGVADQRAGVRLSCLMSVASLALLGVIGVRFLPPWAAIYGMLCMALSLSDLVIARRCWQDAVVGALGLTLVWSACEITREHRNWWNYAVLIGAGSLSALVKELGALVYGGCVLYILVLLFRRRAWKAIAWLVLAGLAAAGLSFYCLTLAAGGLTPLLTGWQHMSGAVNTNPYAWEYQNLPWYQLFWGFWILSPVNLVLAGFAVGLALLPERRLADLSLPRGPVDVRLLRLFSGMTVLLVAVILIVPTLQNFRYLAPIYGPMYLLGGIGLWVLLRLVARRVRGVAYQACAGLLAVAVLAGVFSQYRHFEQVYVTKGAADLSIKMVLDTRN